MDAAYFCHKSTGTLCFDPKQNTKHFEPWWAVVECDDGIIEYYAWFLKKRGIPLMINKLWGAHISAIKGEEPPLKEHWGKTVEVEFWYTNQTRFDNGKHAWLDVYSPQLRDIRKELGLLVEKDRFHMTVGRWVW